MKAVVETNTPDRRKPIGLLSGSIIAACLSLVFGACLLTMLDARHPSRPAASFELSRSGQAAAKVISASF